MGDYVEINTRLRERLVLLERRYDQILEGVRHSDGPIDPDFEEQAVECANDEVLDSLDEVTRLEIESIYATIGRIERGEFGICKDCGEPIPAARLEVLPQTEFCVGCAEQGR